MYAKYQVIQPTGNFGNLLNPLGFNFMHRLFTESIFLQKREPIMMISSLFCNFECRKMKKQFENNCNISIIDNHKNAFRSVFGFDFLNEKG